MSGAGTGPIPFDPRRFRSTAEHYLAGRAEYAPRLIARVAALCGLTPSDRVLDLGCGPGPLALAFAPRAGEVVALDPEPEMLREGEREAARRGLRVTFAEGHSGSLGPSLGRFRLVVMGRSFHWMDRAETLRRLDALVERGGAVAVFLVRHPKLPENAWGAEFRRLCDRCALETGPPAAWRLPGWVRHEAFLLDSAFSDLERASVIERRRLPAARLVARAFSQSGTSPARLGPARAAALRAEIEALAARIAPEGELTEVVESTALIARRPGEVEGGKAEA